MKMKSIVVLVLALVVLSLPLYAGGEAETSAGTATGSSGPQYGGTLTLGDAIIDPSTADVTEGQWPTTMYTSYVLDYLLTGDIDKYGPRGSNEFAFTSPLSVPEGYTNGGVIESFEVTSNKLIFHVRPGVQWAAVGKEHVMESRELTAEDIAFSLLRFWNAPPMTWLESSEFPDWLIGMYAEDRYTFVVEYKYFSAIWRGRLGAGWANDLYPPEVVEAGAHDWNNLVGTGPFMIKDYIPGSAMIYERNPLFYDKTTINGVEYEIPFIDEIVLPIIPDESTRMASLRTGKIDYMGGLSLHFKDTLSATENLKVETVMGSWCHTLSFGLTDTDRNLPGTAIADNVEVRRALMLATDREAIAKASFFEADLYSWPVSTKNLPAFTPFDELPASAQELYEYNPEKAKKLLAEAGYPNGFKVIAPVDAGDTTRVDMMSQIVDQWSKVGVTVDMRPMESAAMSEFMSREAGVEASYDIFLHGEYNIDPLITIGGRFSWVYHDDYLKAKQTADADARTALLKDITVRAIDEVVPGIPLGTPYTLQVSWPWVKNWYGETEESAWGTSHINARIWIDRDLKKELGY
jgi:peptide/nickel transport system substrate-binding protein